MRYYSSQTQDYDAMTLHEIDFHYGLFAKVHNEEIKMRSAFAFGKILKGL